MKKPYFTVLISVILIILSASIDGKAQVCTSIASGSWLSAFTWSCTGANTIPVCGDTIYVSSGDLVSINNQIDFTACASSMVVDITGDLGISNGNKLELPCGSLVSLQTNGQLYKTTPGGGTSTLVSICSSNVWVADDGPKDGPLSFGGFVLPVELLSFEVEHQSGEGYAFNWETATETNNDYFIIYSRNEDGDWKAIDQVNGAGFSNSPRAYSVQTVDKSGKGALFKLEQTDFNGNRETLAYAKPNNFVTLEVETQAWPNPTRDVVSVDASWACGEVNVYLYRIDGSLVFQDLQSTKLNPIVTFSLRSQKLQPGSYFIHLDDGRQHRFARVSNLQ